eukprot:1019188-Pyramimonas_sp.AAC.1
MFVSSPSGSQRNCSVQTAIARHVYGNQCSHTVPTQVACPYRHPLYCHRLPLCHLWAPCNRVNLTPVSLPPVLSPPITVTSQGCDLGIENTGTQPVRACTENLWTRWRVHLPGTRWRRGVTAPWRTSGTPAGWIHPMAWVYLARRETPR